MGIWGCVLRSTLPERTLANLGFLKTLSHSGHGACRAGLTLRLAPANACAALMRLASIHAGTSQDHRCVIETPLGPLGMNSHEIVTLLSKALPCTLQSSRRPKILYRALYIHGLWLYQICSTNFLSGTWARHDFLLITRNCPYRSYSWTKIWWLFFK